MASASSVTLEQLASALIAVFEGERLKAYQDSGGVWTIGIGHTGPDVVEGMVASPEQVAAWFKEDQAVLIWMVRGMTPAKGAAFVSFGFNCGRSALAKVLNGFDTISNPVHTTDRHGNVLSGLVARRRLESLLIQL